MENPLSTSPFMQSFQRELHRGSSDASFGIPQLSAALNLSRSTIHRKIKAETGKSTSIYIREFRLQRAHHLIANSERNIKEVAFNCGFSDVAYFCKCFKEHFGYSPSEVRKKELPDQ